jgi:hypothetical protein
LASALCVSGGSVIRWKLPKTKAGRRGPPSVFLLMVRSYAASR